VDRQTKNNDKPDTSYREEGKITARTIAIDVLNKFDPERNYAGPILDKLLHKTDQRQRATDLVFGTVRNRLAIDTVIAKLSRCPVERIPAKLLNILRIGAYELIYSPETGEYAIVYEAAENAKAIADKKQVGFVNAVLRQIARLITNRQGPFTAANVTRTLPQTPATSCEFAISFLPDPQASPADYLSTAFSLPKWLVADWLAEFGFANTWQICLASNRRPSIYIRPNPLKTATQKLATKLCREGIDAEIVCSVIPAEAGIQKTNALDDSMIRLKSPKQVSELPGFAEGEFTVQDISSAQAVRFLKPKSHWSILDLCAAPGVKTTQLAEATGDKAQIIATDIDSQRLEKLDENIARLGLRSITIVAYEQLFKNPKSEIRNPKFDAVLLDVPCSNTGVLARRIEVRYRIKQNAIKQLVEVQSRLLSAAAESVKPGGKICYSTCSIQKEENSELIKNFLLQNPAFHLEFEKLILPSAQCRTNCSSPKWRKLSLTGEQDLKNDKYPHQASIGAADHDGGYVAVLKHGL
jgi:16S rRNA (cytosine967-C5)-methyltransferase